MKPLILIMLSALALGWPRQAAAQEDYDFSFFREEAQFITASLRGAPRRKVPASASVITADEIKASGASTLWDALRLVPGLDVAETRTGQGDVSARGFNQSNSKRLLVLLDGRTVLQEFFGITVWEQIPVGMDEIDRIEIVKGPASALYGANAIHGVINIVTKSPEQLEGGSALVSAGGRAGSGAFLYGRSTGKVSFKAGADYRDMRRFSDGDLTAAQVAKVHALAAYKPGADAEWRLSGSADRFDGQLGIGNYGVVRPLSNDAHLRLDYRGGGLSAQAFWNTSSAEVRDLWGGPALRNDTYDVNITQELSLAGSDSLVVGAGYRRNQVEADIFDEGGHHQDLYSLFAENTWEPSEKWSVITGARLDRNSLSGSAFSPRGSVLYFPDEKSVLRVTAGTAFRTPTLTENYISFTQTVPFSSPAYPGINAVATITRGDRHLGPEKMKSVEAAYNGTFGRFKAGLLVYGYWIRDMIATGAPSASINFPTLVLTSTWINSGRGRAIGGEAAAEYSLSREAKVFADYSYFHASQSGYRNNSRQSPMHKINGGLNWARGRFSGMFWANWTGPTWWDANLAGSGPDLRRVGSYLLLNTGLNYGLGGGFEARLKAFNFLENRHYEVLPWRSASDVGQYGEIVGGRYALELSYRFI